MVASFAPAPERQLVVRLKDTDIMVIPSVGAAKDTFVRAIFASPAEGSWTYRYPELTTGPVDYIDHR